ncbi:Uncharacterised protein [Acholeplasma oculi]|uniref:Uncharacterized protein n=1 Tax=Acholeplasma oculi TaxID=35623 RepID=A0A061AHN1_9MOLU|nr:hypothetical protein [Acholeplasma oculi]CDR31111.1 hypothetical protein Aocu_10380 [Acholeplasma oculi]SKC37116.1 hypothetical protein SAMN02745122_0469 [Acholeplasma oculi]SUT90821.1 Uncharacterised protein [Acholeplasma oculi]
MKKNKKKKVIDFINKDYIDENGNAIVDVVINDRSELFSPYSNKMLLRREIFLYLDTIADPIPNEYPLIINFIVKDLNILNQEYVREALKRYYWFSYKEMEKNLRKDMLFVFLYLVIGLLLIIGFNFFDFSMFGITDAWVRIIDSFLTIFVWVIVWEAISQLIIGRGKKVAEMLNEKQMAIAEVRFFDSLSEVATEGSDPNMKK